MSNHDWISPESLESLTQADPLVAAVAAATIATALAFAHALPRVLAEHNWKNQQEALARARGAINQALRADVQACLSPEDRAILEAARARLMRHARRLQGGIATPFVNGPVAMRGAPEIQQGGLAIGESAGRGATDTTKGERMPSPAAQSK